MSTAKQIVMNDLLNISDDVQDEVRAYFSKKYKKNEVLA